MQRTQQVRADPFGGQASSDTLPAAVKELAGLTTEVVTLAKTKQQQDDQAAQAVLVRGPHDSKLGKNQPCIIVRGCVEPRTSRADLNIHSSRMAARTARPPPTLRLRLPHSR